MISHAGQLHRAHAQVHVQLATNRTNCIERPVDRAREGRATLLLLLLALFALRTASVGPISRRAPLTTMCFAHADWHSLRSCGRGQAVVWCVTEFVLLFIT